MCSHGNDLLLMNPHRVAETILYHRLMETHQPAVDRLEKPVPLSARWVNLQSLTLNLFHQGVGRSSEVERSLMVRWVVGSILHGVDPLSCFSFRPVLHDWLNKGRGMCYPVCGMVHIKEPLLLIDKSSLCGSSRFPLSLSE